MIICVVQGEDVVGGEVNEIAWNTTPANLLCVRFVPIGRWPDANIGSLTHPFGIEMSIILKILEILTCQVSQVLELAWM
jgi:hypothetical protein